MEAELVEELPTGDWQYEPKWDGFRGVLENLGGELALWSRNERPLLRYFPELEPLGKLLPPDSALDGEIMIATKGSSTSTAAAAAPSRPRAGSASSRPRSRPSSSPSTSCSGRARSCTSCRSRSGARSSSGRRSVPAVARTTRDLAAGGALARPARGGRARRRGREAARRSVPPGSRDGVVKVKKYRTADCVIVGLPLEREGGGPDLDAAARAVRRRRRARLRRPLLGVPGRGAAGARGGAAEDAGAGLISDKRIPGGQSRWSRGKELDWNPVRPELVCEVRFDKLEGNRFRHGTKFIRFRPDKDPTDCTWDQVRAEAKARRPDRREPLAARIARPVQRPGRAPSERERPLAAALDELQESPARGRAARSAEQARLAPPHAGGQVADLSIRLRIVLTVKREGSERATSFHPAEPRPARPASAGRSRPRRSSGRARSGRSRRRRRAGRPPARSSSRRPGRRRAARPPPRAPSRTAAPPGTPAPA